MFLVQHLAHDSAQEQLVTVPLSVSHLATAAKILRATNRPQIHKIMPTTSTISRADLIALARAAAEAHQLDAALVCAICEQESAWNPWAIRYEPAFFTHYIAPQLNAGQISNHRSASPRIFLGPDASDGTSCPRT